VGSGVCITVLSKNHRRSPRSCWTRWGVGGWLGGWVGVFLGGGGSGGCASVGGPSQQEQQHFSRELLDMVFWGGPGGGTLQHEQQLLPLY
jgi:hypothetical protein